MALRSKTATISQSRSGLDRTGQNLTAPRQNTPVYDHLPVSDIRPSPNNARALELTLEDLKNPSGITDDNVRAEAEYIIDLSRTVKDQGQLQPAVGFRTPGGTVELLGGERRWWACQLAGVDRMHIMVYAEKPDDHAVRHLIENIHRRDLDPAGVFRGILYVLEEQERLGQPVKTGTELSRLLNIPKTMAYRWWAVNQGPEDVRYALLSGVIPSAEIGEKLTKYPREQRDKIIASANFTAVRQSRVNEIPPANDDIETEYWASSTATTPHDGGKLQSDGAAHEQGEGEERGAEAGQAGEWNTTPSASDSGEHDKASAANKNTDFIDMGRTTNRDLVRRMIATLAPDISESVTDWSEIKKVQWAWRQTVARYRKADASV